MRSIDIYIYYVIKEVISLSAAIILAGRVVSALGISIFVKYLGMILL